MAKDPYKNSAYDASGMPLGAEQIDYDVKEDVAKATVKDKYQPPLPLFSDKDDFEEPEIKRTKFNPALNNTAIQFPGHRIHKAHKEDLGHGIPEHDDMPKFVDLDDPKSVEEMVKEDPKESNKAKLESDKLDHSDKSEKKDEKKDENKDENKDDGDDFLKALKNA